jgi:hypothetical protein
MSGGGESCHLEMGAKVSSFQNDTSGLYGFLAGGSGRTDGRTDEPTRRLY